MSQLRKVLHEDHKPKIIVLTGGLIAGFSEIITTYPLDTIKTNLQINPNKYKNMFDCGKHIFFNFGFRPFFNGMSASLAQVGGKVAIRFTIYDLIMESLPKNKYSSLFSGLIAGSIEAIIWTAPTERIKILQQKNYNSIMSSKKVAYNIIKEKGFLGLYTGTFPTIIKQSSSVGSRFWMYTYLKDLYKNDTNHLSLFNTMLIGGIAGSFSASINQPIDVIKSIIQSSSKKITIKDATKNIIKKHGFKGFFFGLNARILRVGIAQAVTFGVYENYITIMNNFYKY